jgi:hypothetical protein
MRLQAIIFPLLIICLSNSLLSQEKPELFSKIEQVFKEKEPAWKIERVNTGESSDPARQSIVFRSDEGQASVDVTIWKREKDAREVFAAESLAFDNRAGKRMVKDTLPKLGDENHVWTPRGSTAWPMLTLRKGKVNVTVFAPSVAVAKRFAQHVLEQIPAS